MVTIIHKKLIAFILMVVISNFFLTTSYAFVGGAHGGFSGGYHGGGYHGSSYHSGSHSNSKAQPVSMTESLVFFAGLIGIILLLSFIDIWMKTSGLGKKLKRSRQKKYITRCRHTPVSPHKVYSTEQLNKTLQTLRQRALLKLQQWDSFKSKTEQQLQEEVIQAFDSLQRAWSAQDTTKVLIACNNMRFSGKMVGQIEQMKSLGVSNYIADTKITACNLVKCREKVCFSMPILCFALKGSQVDEYFIEEEGLKNKDKSRRDFNCLVEVTPFLNSFKIYQVKINGCNSHIGKFSSNINQTI